jgi:hypothetical protein
MTTFDDREKAAESKFALDEETAFKVRARRDKLVGAWAAGLLGLEGAEALAYPRSLLETDLRHKDDDDLVAKLLADFNARKVLVSEAQIKSMIYEKMGLAQQQIKEGH